MKFSGITIARVAGVPIVLNGSWYLIAALVTVTFGSQLRGIRPELGWGAFAVALGYAVLLLGSVLVHELAHALTARALGQRVRVIELNLWGGHTEFNAAATTWRAHILVAAAGPVSNFALGALGWAALRLAVDPVADAWSVLRLLLWALVFSNVLVAAFNALPGLPLDGGAVLEAIVWAATGNRHRGTIVAGWSGRAVVALLLVGVLGVPWFLGRPPDLYTVVVAALIGAFMWSGAGAAVKAGQLRLRLPSLTVPRLMHPAAVIGTRASVAEARAAARAIGATAVVVLLDEASGTVAVVDAPAAAAVPDAVAGATPAGAVARVLPGAAVLPASLGGEALLDVVSRRPAPEYLVIDAQRRIVGLLVRDELESALRQ